MEFTAQAIAEFLKGEIAGDPAVTVNTIAKIEEGKKGALSFLANPKYEPYIYETDSSVVLVNRDFRAAKPVKATLVRVDDAYEAFASLLTLVEQSRPRKKGIHPSAIVGEGTSIGGDAYIGAYVYIGENCKIGNNCRIYPQSYIGDGTVIGDDCLIYQGVKIYHECIIGNSCTIHAGSVIGSDGFGFAPQSESEFMKIPQIGNVILEDHVEIGANATIDRATMGSTIIRRGVKLDNLIQVGHNVEIGENTVMAAQTGIAGSTRVGSNCMFGGQVGIAGHLRIADNTRLGAQAGVAGSIKEENRVYTGTPAVDHRIFLRSSVIIRKLPELKKQVDALEKEVKDIRKDKA
ncbi:MAG: UDP-3-O-(3-hydroxymyristoyl)glucosamine N-acyltransferase [Bacteroidales bacterium]|jgi:UDP-3-O-[3-hydroxymyristoyl] glucosamine N-acyltransferase|nr:UDP-3-O-(3-hydroxymyristoyl)glucosamine N-acyltransferase [Bacteroidales bacterium]